MLKPLSRCPHADIQKEHGSLKYLPGEQALSKNGDEHQYASNLSSIPGFARVVLHPDCPKRLKSTASPYRVA